MPPTPPRIREHREQQRLLDETHARRLELLAAEAERQATDGGATSARSE
jgi:hypothetical protein